MYYCVRIETKLGRDNHMHWTSSLLCNIASYALFLLAINQSFQFVMTKMKLGCLWLRLGKEQDRKEIIGLLVDS